MALTSGTYQIGSAAGSMVDVEEPPSNTVYTRPIMSTRIDGAPYISAYAEVTWEWEAMSQAAYNQLYGYWPINATSNTRYIRTRIESGAGISYQSFSCVMGEPESQMDHTFRKKVKVRFTKVEAV